MPDRRNPHKAASQSGHGRLQEFPFRLDVPGIECMVYLNPNLQWEGVVDTAYSGKQVIVLRERNERVLLHEVLHRLIQTDEERPLSFEAEERLVRRLTRGLWDMGWRWE